MKFTTLASLLQNLNISTLTFGPNEVNNFCFDLSEDKNLNIFGHPKIPFTYVTTFFKATVQGKPDFLKDECCYNKSTTIVTYGHYLML